MLQPMNRLVPAAARQQGKVAAPGKGFRHGRHVPHGHGAQERNQHSLLKGDGRQHQHAERGEKRADG